MGSNVKEAETLHHRNVSASKSWAGGIRTLECRSQSPVPYRLATAQSIRSPKTPGMQPYRLGNSSASAGFKYAAGASAFG